MNDVTVEVPRIAPVDAIASAVSALSILGSLPEESTVGLEHI